VTPTLTRVPALWREGMHGVARSLAGNFVEGDAPVLLQNDRRWRRDRYGIGSLGRRDGLRRHIRCVDEEWRREGGG
jgi:hypothetical protein